MNQANKPNFIIRARRLVNFINELDSFETVSYANSACYDHIGALYTDVILQAGLNYRNVVKPRVDYVLKNYPSAKTVSSFSQLSNDIGFEKVLNWKHPEKISRMRKLIEFSFENLIETCDDLYRFLDDFENHLKITEIKGIGPKTLDYMMKLLNFDTVAVDRHIYSFLELAGIEGSDYTSTKMTVEYAADLMCMSRKSMDSSIWKFMSQKQYYNADSYQLTFSI